MRRVLLWFKQDLRLDDHPALQAARGVDALLPVFILDPAQLQPGPLGSRGLGALTGMLLGSVSNYLLTHVEAPVFIVK